MPCPRFSYTLTSLDAKGRQVIPVSLQSELGHAYPGNDNLDADVNADADVDLRFSNNDRSSMSRDHAPWAAVR